MALVKGTNSYGTIAEANAYFEDRLDVAAWAKADETIKSQALVTASALLNDYNWVGTAISDSQLLAFPRVGSYFDPRLGLAVSLTSAIPTRVTNASYELAYHLLNNDGVLDSTGTLKDITVGSISLNIRTDPETVPSIVRKLIKPLLVNAGSNMWWRAN